MQSLIIQTAACFRLRPSNLTVVITYLDG